MQGNRYLRQDIIKIAKDMSEYVEMYWEQTWKCMYTCGFVVDLIITCSKTTSKVISNEVKLPIELKTLGVNYQYHDDAISDWFAFKR